MKYIINILMILLPYILLSSNFCAAQSKNINGVFAFGWANNFVNTPAFGLDYVDGFTAYTGWDLVEIEENEYDWSALDVLLNKAKRSNKILNIGVYPGANSPQWIYKYDIQTIEWEDVLTEDVAKYKGIKSRVLNSPLPWDPVYLIKWKKFIKALASRYGNEKSIGYISLTGPTIQALAMGIPLKEKKDINNFNNKGYSDDKIISAWCEIMDYYALVLPRKKWALAVAPLIIGAKNPWPAYKIVDYGLKKYPDNLIIMGVYLNDTWFKTGGPVSVNNQLIKMSSRYTITGFQMAQSAHRNATWKRQKKMVTDLMDSFRNGYDLGVSFLEVWHNADIILPRSNLPNPRYIKDLKYIHESLMVKSQKVLDRYDGDFDTLYSNKIKRTFFD